MNTTELEFAISQYVDGDLPPAEQAALEEVLATDHDARALLVQYQSLQTALTSTLPVPQVDYGALGERISAAVAREEMPVRHFAMPWAGLTGRLAVAASVLLAIGVGIVTLTLRNRPATDGSGPTTGGDAPMMVVVGPQAQAADAPAVEQVTIGPSDQFAGSWRYGEAVVSRPSRVLIYSALDPAQDTRLLSY